MTARPTPPPPGDPHVACADAQLLVAVRDGSLDALGRLYARHAGRVYRLAFCITGSHEEAEDVLQDVFVGMPRALRTYDERGRFEAWLKRIAVRVALMRMRAVRRKREAPLEAAGEAVQPRGAHPVDRIELERILTVLPDPLRVVFVLREIEGYTHREIAELLGISQGNSAVRLSRAWAILRKEARP